MSKNESEKKVSKAGVILFDRGEEPRDTPDGLWKEPEGLKVLATYTQGRFDDHGEYLVPAKGSIDPLHTSKGRVLIDEHHHIRYEKPIKAAVRECREETGIDIRKLLGDENYEKFLDGMTITNLKSPGYPGVEIVHASDKPVKDHTYVSGHGSRQRAQYFAIEVRGIEKLRGDLKAVVPGENELAPKDRIRSDELAKQKGLPDFEQMMDILRTGMVPVVEGAAWSGNKPKHIIAHPKLPELEKAWLTSHQRQHAKMQPAEWLEFMADPALAKEYKAMLADIEALKKYLEKKKLIGDCDGCLKMDSKDRPLTFYKEGGTILRLRDMVASMDRMAAENPIYARAVWGEYRGSKKPDVDTAEQMKRAQIAPMLEYLAGIAPMELAYATIDSKSDRAMRAVSGMAEPVVASAAWQGKVIANAASRTAHGNGCACDHCAVGTREAFTDKETARRAEAVAAFRQQA